MLNANLTNTYSTSSMKKGKIRFLFLMLIVCVAFGNQYAFNNPQALEETLYEHLKITETEFQLFYSLYSLPNIFTLLFIGFFLDKFGMRIGIVLLSFCLVLFQLLFAIGGQIESFGLMLTARILFGIASRSLFIPQTSLISFWFKGRQLSFALGVGITFPQLGNALNSYLTPLIYEATGSLGPPLFTSMGFCIVGFICAIFVSKIDKRAEDIDIANDLKSEVSEYSLDTEESKHEPIKVSDLRELSSTFWIVSVLCTLTMTQYIPFLDNANRLYQKRFCFTQTTAGEVITITYIATALFSGPLGILVNKVGFRRFFIMGATFIFFIAHTLIWVYPQCNQQSQYAATWGLLLLGIGYSFYANVIVAAIPMVVQKKVLGSAIGIMEIISSLAECVVPLVTATMIQNSENKEDGFKKSSFFFFLIGLFGVLTSFSLFFIDRKMKKKLDKGEGRTLQPDSFDQIEIPSEYRRIEDEARGSLQFPVKQAKRSTSSAIQLASKQLF